MELTPVDMMHVQFRRAVRGYSVSEVDDFVRRAASAMESCAQESADLKETVEQLTAEVRRVREIETTMTNALALAQKTADEVKANAHREAEVALREADQMVAQRLADGKEEMASLKAQIESFKEQRDRFESELRSLIRSYSEWLDTHSGGKRKKAEKDH